MNWVMYRGRQVLHALRWLLLPAYIVWRIYSVLRCDFGWHKWQWQVYPMWRRYEGRPYQYRREQVCKWCRCVNLRSTRYTPHYYDDESEAGEA